MRVVVLLALLLSACGRIAFDPLEDANAKSWWNPSWTTRIPLVVDHTKVAGDLADFPVLVEPSSIDLSRALPTGADLRFVDGAGQLLPFDLEASSPLVAWVKFPAVSASVDTTFYLYFGNPTASDAQQRAVVWSEYASVYHFGRVDPLDVADSTGANQGINNGATTGIGLVLGAAQFSGGPNVGAGTAGVDTSAGGFNTVSFWMHYEGAYGKSPFAFLDATDRGYDIWVETPTCVGFNTENGEVIGAPIGDLAGRWSYVAAVFYNGVPDTVHNQLWIDGMQLPLSMCAGTTALARSAAGTIDWASTHTYELLGMLDEARIAPGIHSPAWIKTEVVNQSSPSTFVTAGPAELVR